MKRKILTLVLILIATQFSFAQLSPVITSWIINTTGATGYDGIESNVQIVQYDDSNVYVSATCIPGYDIGPWDGDPNVPVNQNFVLEIPRYPKPNSGTLTAVGLGHVGVWSNGVSIFNASDGMSYNNLGYWHRNAYYFEGESFDSCLGHAQQQGEYHHHCNPRCLYNDADSTHHSPIIGYAFDGFPIYGAYGFANANGTGGIKRMRSSYQLRKMVNRDTLANGTVLNSADYGPAVSVSYPLGDFMEDYQYIANSGDLDANNGRFCITPDYPSGIYAYFVTIDSTLTPVYPYVLGADYFGTVQTADIGQGSGHVTITDSTTVYTTTGIAPINNTIKFMFTPNPVSTYGYIYFEPSSPNNIVGTIYNLKGELIRTIKNLQPSISYAINMTDYAPGVYFLHLTSGNQEVIQKIIKIK